MRVDFNLFRVFAAIYTNGGVSAAAEVLHLTQPAVSHALARLRDQLGDPLFVRLGQGMVPTPVAHKLIGPVRKALGEIEQAVKAIETFDPALAAMQFRIGFSALMEAALFPRIVCEILPKAPGIRVEAVRYNRADMAMALASSQLNAVIDIEMANPGEMIHSRRLASGRIVGVARRDHPVVTARFARRLHGARPHRGIDPATGRDVRRHPHRPFDDQNPTDRRAVSVDRVRAPTGARNRSCPDAGLAVHRRGQP